MTGLLEDNLHPELAIADQVLGGEFIRVLTGTNIQFLVQKGKCLGSEIWKQLLEWFYGKTTKA